MGTRITIAGAGDVQTGPYRVVESSTPLAGGDTSGAVGTISLSIAERQNGLLLLEKQLDLIDTALGSTTGTIREIGRGKSDAFPWDITAYSRLDNFNIEVQAQPFTGTLAGAFDYYCSLANIDSGILVDDAFALRPVTFPGWKGNLWAQMKQMATAMGADLNLISNNVVLRPVRAFEAITDRETGGDVSAVGTQLALKQEVIWYDTEYKTNSLIYPSGGWTPEVKVLSVNAGEEVEQVLDDRNGLYASILSVDQPVCVSSVAPDYSATSVYTVIGDDNVVIQPQQWHDFGGRLSVEIGEDTKSLVVKMRGATGLFQYNGNPIRTFRIALSAETSDSTYSTLRIVGDAVHYKEKSIIIPTGVDPWRTGQEFAPTIDNPFLNNLDDAYSAGIRGARRYSGKTVSATATVAAINKRGERGTANYPPYSFVQGEWEGQTYEDFSDWADGRSYGDIRAYYYSLVQDDFDNQAFGNAPGARYWERSVSRWFRIRTCTTEWGQMRFDADDDMTLGDMQKRFSGMTYGDVNDHFDGLSYFEANLMGAA